MKKRAGSQNEDSSEISPDQPASRLRRAVYFCFFAALFLVLIPVVVLFADGYRLNAQWKLVATGGISITEVPAGGEVFVNYRQVRSSAFFNNAFYIPDLVPNDYFIVVAKAGYWSWAKHVVVTAKKVASASSLVLPQKPQLVPITETMPSQSSVGGFDFFASDISTTTLATSTTSVPNPDYATVITLFATTSPDAISLTGSSSPSGSTGLGGSGTSASSGTSADLNAVSKYGMQVWWQGNTIYAEWLGDPSAIPRFFCSASDSVCTATTTVFTATHPISRVDFFPNRSDVLLVLMSDGLYAVETDRRPVQNIQPIYLGNTIDFRVSTDEELYLRETNDKASTYYQVEL